jgi:predicted  nucleic acid-binding Zn-ribbon protein
MVRGPPGDDRRSMSIPARAADDVSLLSDRELTVLLLELEREERSVSRRRNTLHNRIDFVRAGGYASAGPGDDPLEELVATERELSEQRHALHFRIDELRAERSRRRLDQERLPSRQAG